MKKINEDDMILVRERILQIYNKIDRGVLTNRVAGMTAAAKHCGVTISAEDINLASTLFLFVETLGVEYKEPERLKQLQNMYKLGGVNWIAESLQLMGVEIQNIDFSGINEEEYCILYHAGRDIENLKAKNGRAHINSALIAELLQYGKSKSRDSIRGIFNNLEQVNIITTHNGDITGDSLNRLRSIIDKFESTKPYYPIRDNNIDILSYMLIAEVNADKENTIYEEIRRMLVLWDYPIMANLFTGHSMLIMGEVSHCIAEKMAGAVLSSDDCKEMLFGEKTRGEKFDIIKNSIIPASIEIINAFPGILEKTYVFSVYDYNVTSIRF